MASVRRTRVVIRPMGTGRGPGVTPVAIIEDAANIGASQYHNAAGEFYMTLPATHPQVAVIEPYQVHYAVETWHGDRYREDFAGVIVDFDATDNDVVFYGIDYLGMLEKVVDARYDPANADLPHDAGGSKYVDQAITTIIADQLTMAGAKANSPVAFIDSSAFDTFIERATIYSTFASVLGFITGLMSSHRQGTGKRSRFWVRKKVDGYEYLLKDDPGVSRGNLRMEYGGLVQSFRLVAFGDFATTVHGVGRVWNGLSTFYASGAAPGTPPATFGAIEQVRVWDSVQDMNDLTRRVQQEAASAGRIGKRIALALRVDALQPFDGYDIGDYFPLDIKRGVVDTTNYGSGNWSIMGMEFKVFPDGHTENTLVVLPLEDGVAPDTDLIPGVEILAGREWEVGYAAPAQGVNTGKLYLDLTTGKTYILNPDGTYSDLDAPAVPAVPEGLAVSTEAILDATGDPVIKLTVTVNADLNTANRGTWVQVTSETDGAGSPVWDHPVLIFIPVGETVGSIEGVAGNTLYFARAWSVDFVGTPSAVSASELQTSVMDTTAPGIPTAVVVSGGVRGLIAKWPSTTAQDLAFYEFRYAVDDGSDTGPGVSPSWAYQQAHTSVVFIGDLPGDVRYWLQVRAVDRSGNVLDPGPPEQAVNYLSFPEIGWSGLGSGLTTLVDADLIALGAITDEHVASISAGKVITGLLKIQVSDATMIDGVEVYDGDSLVGRWDETGLYVYDATDPTGYIQLFGAGLTLFRNGVPVSAFTADGFNAGAITFGAMPGGHNLVPNSSFEMAAFDVPVTVTTIWTASADWSATRQGSDTNVTTNASDLQETGATY